MQPALPADRKSAHSMGAYLPFYDYSSYMTLERGRTPEGGRPPLIRVSCAGVLYEVRNDPAATYIAEAPDWRPVPEGKRIYTARAISPGYYAHVPRAPALPAKRRTRALQVHPQHRGPLKPRIRPGRRTLRAGLHRSSGLRGAR